MAVEMFVNMFCDVISGKYVVAILYFLKTIFVQCIRAYDID